ncbi:HAD family hydrolase [Lichenifustis flavocetrariae]|uniref:HAD family hydrolase n=1 Tax=Lichenifustis flavocetrariae TaxID=2949735 RepID=A0AA42CNR3_9HYPH|nr:HAD family hydrolase [Lichenifustis flavocetrariae]MCW6509662.1 HAD family hydrolase [Lichenifustis flavocetrariae]
MTQTRPPILDASAVIFDVDGTLVDSVDFHAEAWQRTFSAFGFEFDLIKVREQIGKGGDQLLPVFLDGDILEKQGKKIEAYRQDLFEREYFHRVIGFPQVPELFRFLIDAGKTIALGSSAKTDDLKVYKKAAGIEGMTTVETTSDDAERSKPHPDIFLAALDRLKLPAKDVVVVGDTPYDVEAAMKAGMKSTGLLCGGFSEDSLRKAGAVDVYRDPGHLLQVLQAA